MNAALESPDRPAPPYTLAGAARFLSVSEKTVSRLIASGKIKTVNIGLRKVLIPAVEIERLATGVPAGA